MRISCLRRGCTRLCVRALQGMTKYVKGGEKTLMEALLTKGPMTGAPETTPPLDVAPAACLHEQRACRCALRWFFPHPLLMVTVDCPWSLRAALVLPVDQAGQS